MLRLVPAIVLLLSVAAFGRAALAVDTKTRLPPAPAVLSADRVSYDEDLGLVVASGHVEISQNDLVLLADTVTYNQRADTITASGNVSLLNPDGTVVFANFFELSNALKDGVAQNFRMLLTDNSRFAAAGARRQGGTLTEMVKGVYSPCELCKDDPDRAPLWQIKAARIVHDDTEKEVYYEDAMLEMGGIPIAYTPYLAHPDPSVKRKSGFLAPSYGQSTALGTMLRTPYFMTAGPDKDLTVAPIFATKADPILDTEYRERWGDGHIDIQGSATNASNITNNHKDSVGGNIKGNGIFNLSDHWRTGFDVQRETSDTYLGYYKLLPSAPTVLPAHAFAEGYMGRSYNSLETYAFQDTRSTVNIRNLPIVAPVYQFNYVSEAGDYGQRWTSNASALNLMRAQGTDTHRLSQNTQWELPYTSPVGDMYSLALSMQTDGYSTEDNVNPNNPTGLRSDNAAGRAMPQAKFEWRYPWVRQDGSYQELVEPRMAFIAGPQGRNTFLIPNEDSLDFEFDDQNLYSLNPFPGVDRVSGGERVVYGASAGAYGSQGGTTNIFLGQLYRFHKDDTFPSYSGLANQRSDYVGHVQIKPLKYVDLTYRYRFAAETLTPQSTQLISTLGTRDHAVSVSYLSVTQDVAGYGVSDIEQVAVSPTMRLTEFWMLQSSAVYDLSVDRFRSMSTSAIYKDECFDLVTTVSRSYARNGPIQPSTTFLVTLVYKGLGDIRLGGSGG